MWVSVDLKHITNKKCVMKETLHDNLNYHLSSITMGHSPIRYAIAIMKWLHKVQSTYVQGRRPHGNTWNINLESNGKNCSTSWPHHLAKIMAIIFWEAFNIEVRLLLGPCLAEKSLSRLSSKCCVTFTNGEFKFLPWMPTFHSPLLFSVMLWVGPH